MERFPFCGACGVEVKPSDQVCPSCGHALDGEIAEVVYEIADVTGGKEQAAERPQRPSIDIGDDITNIEADTVNIHQPAGEPQEYTPYCRRCGTYVARDVSKRCPRCGVVPLCWRHHDGQHGLCAVCAPAAFTAPENPFVPPTSRPIAPSVSSTAAAQQPSPPAAAPPPPAAAPPRRAEAPPPPAAAPPRRAEAPPHPQPLQELKDWVRGLLAAAPPPPADEVLAGHVELAGFAPRFGSFCVDLVLSVVIYVVYVKVTPDEGGAGFFWILFVIFIVNWLYWASKGWSPGKLVFGIRITSMDGNAPGWKVALQREIIGKIATILSFGQSYWSVDSDPLHQARHDKIAGTIVVRKPR